jgi:hypothetical protein
MRVKIEVTETDIQRGIPENECRCPIARAFRRVFSNPQKMMLEVTPALIRYISKQEFGKGDWYRSKLPEKAVVFIKLFDLHMKVKPFSFCLNLPDKYVKK